MMDGGRYRRREGAADEWGGAADEWGGAIVQ